MASVFPDNRREQYLEKPLPSSDDSERVILGAILIGVAAGLLSGLLGIGGGALFVPGLVLVLGLGQVEGTVALGYEVRDCATTCARTNTLIVRRRFTIKRG